MDELKTWKRAPFNIWSERMACYWNSRIPFGSWIFLWNIVGKLSSFYGGNGISPKALSYHLYEDNSVFYFKLNFYTTEMQKERQKLVNHLNVNLVTLVKHSNFQKYEYCGGLSQISSFGPNPVHLYLQRP